MREFYVDPTTNNSPPASKGFGEQDKPDTVAPAKEDKPQDKANIVLEVTPVGQANISFQRDIKKARAIATEQQRNEKEWETEHKASTAST